MDVSNSSRCLSCLARKWTCDGARPVCARCHQEAMMCSYDWSLDNGIFQLFPASANLNKAISLERGAQQVANGGFARVYRTQMYNGNLVAVKVFFDHKRPPARALELSVREAFTWQRLHHINIVPFLGIADYAKIRPGVIPQLCLVSPWMAGGNIMDYLKTNPTASPFPLMMGIVEAVSYLHSLPSGPIVHGDLKGNNILMDVRGSVPIARLIDFGLAQIMEAGMEDDAGTTSTGYNGNARWLAFERLLPERYGLRQAETKTTVSDIFELMRTFFEILTGGPPFEGKSDYAAIADALQFSNPERPTRCHWIDDDRWELMLACWSDVRESRPSLAALQNDLKWSIAIDTGLTEDPYVDLLSLMRGGTPLRRLLAQRGRIAAVTFALDTTPHSSIHQLGRILRQLDIHVLRFSHSRQWIPPEKMEDILQLTPSLQHLELCASAPSLAIDSAPFLDVAERHAPHLTTLILRNVPTSFGRLSSQILRNLEVRTNINQPQSNTERVLAFCQLLERTPSLERLVLHDMTPSEDSWWPDPSSWGFERVAGESYLMALARRSPRLLRLRVFHLRTSNYVEASAYLGLLSRSNLTELSVWLGKRYSFPTYTYWNIEQLRVWPQLRVLSLPVLSLAPPNGMNLVRLFKELTGLEDLEWDRDNFLDLVTLAFDETAILPSLKTLRLRSKGTVRHANASIGRFLRARDNAGLPVERLLIHGDGVTDFFRHERELQAIRVLIGGYRHRDGFEGANAALEPVDVLFSEAVLKKYGLWGEQSQKAKQSQNDGRGVGRSRPVQE